MPPFKLSDNDLNEPADAVFQIGRCLGEGAFGGVYVAIHKSSGTNLAVKRVPLGSALKDLVKEIVIMRQCKSINIVNYYGSYYLNKELWIVMEHCTGGSVNDLIQKVRSLSEDCISAILHGTLSGLIYLHGIDMIHRDLKSGNILLSESGIVKLADFGVSGQLTNTMRKRNSCVGTPYWMSPEIIQQVGYNTSTDIWSLGITAIEMAERYPPLAEVFPMRAMFLIPVNPSPTLRNPSKWSSRFNDFIKRCLEKTPSDRAYARELIDHPFILDHSNSPEVIVDAVKISRELDSEAVSDEECPTVIHEETLTNSDGYHTVDQDSFVNLRHSAKIDPSVLTNRKINRSESVSQQYLTCSSEFDVDPEPFSFATAPGVRAHGDEGSERTGITNQDHYKPSFDLRRNTPTITPNTYSDSSDNFQTMIVHDDSSASNGSQNDTMLRYDTASAGTMVRHDSDVFFKTAQHTDYSCDTSEEDKSRRGSDKENFCDLSDTLARNYGAVALRSPGAKQIRNANSTLDDLKAELEKVERRKQEALQALRRKYEIQRRVIQHEIEVRKCGKRQ